jgi:hypothetical protein
MQMPLLPSSPPLPLEVVPVVLCSSSLHATSETAPKTERQATGRR